jgi:hypothetical protein
VSGELGTQAAENHVQLGGEERVVVGTRVRTVDALSQELNITHYELFGLRDADSAKDDPFHQFGIMRDDYTPKPAFSTFQRLIQELGA